MIIDALTCRYPIKDLLLSLQMAKSSYFYPSYAMKKDTYAHVRENLREAFDENRKCYGYRRLHAVLTSAESTLSDKVVLRLMHKENLVFHL